MTGFHSLKVYTKVFFITLITLITSCSLPTDQETVKWNFSAAVPLAKEIVPLWEQIDTAMKDINSGESGSTELLKEDQLIILRKDTITTEMDLADFFPSTSVEENQKMGSIIIEGVAPISLPLPALPGETVLADGHTVFVALPVTSDGEFEELLMASDPQSMPVTLRNNSSTNPVTLFSVSIARHGITETLVSGPALAPASEATVNLPMENVHLSTTNGHFIFSVEFQNPVTPADIAEVDFSLNGLIISSGRLSAQLFPDSISIGMVKDFADSLKIDSVHFDEVELISTIENSLGVPSTIQAFLFNEDSTIITPLWESPIDLPSGSSELISTLEDIALYPIWNEEEQKTLLSLGFSIYPNKRSGMVDFNATDSVLINFTIGEQRVKSLAGVFVNGMIEENTADEWEMPEVLADDIREAVIGKLFIEGSSISSRFVAQFDAESFVDSVELDIITEYSTEITPKKTSNNVFQFSTINGGVEHTLQFASDSVVSSLPENLNSASTITIPEGTPFNIVTLDNSLKIPFILYMDFSIPLHFYTTDSVTIVTEVEAIEIPKDEIQSLKSIEDPKIILNMTYRNYSPVELKVFGIMADYSQLQELEAIPSEQFNPGMIDADMADEYYYITGNSYQKLRVSDQDTTVSWDLGSRAIRSFTENDTICMRFCIKLPDDSDMDLSSSSALEIKSGISIKGIMSSDFPQEFE